MKRKLLCLFALLLLCLCFAACAEKEGKTVPAYILELGSGEDSLPGGYIDQSVIELADGEPVNISMDDVFAMYPDHSGVYGVILSEGEVTLSPNGGSAAPVTGSGVIEFAFPGAENCSLSGSGKVYAYFLPVPYMRLSSDVSLTDQAFDTSYMTETSVGHQNMFMLTDPHMFVFQEGIPAPGTVYKLNMCLGEIPERYAQFKDSQWNTSIVPFLFDTPVMVQCDALSLQAYQTDRFSARPMVKAAVTEGLEIWCYKDYEPAEGTYERITDVFDTALHVAYEQIMGEGLKVDPVLMVMLRDEMARVHGDGLAVSEEMQDRLMHANYIYYDTRSWENVTDYSLYLCAHELGHIVQNASCSISTISSYCWVSEGFAEYFADKVCARLGINYSELTPMNQKDTLLLDKFSDDLKFGVHGPDEYYGVLVNGWFPMDPQNRYTFGHLFMMYLDDVYGKDFYKKVSDSFYQNFYKGHESTYLDRRCEIDYNVDLYFELFKADLSEDVYLNYPAYAREHFSGYLAQ
ncbi:MAG: hypothetical protein K5663_08610 [Clostridiales bacterium]|nr:hypothetical protein [Clostridiales bacterium]